MLRTSIVIDYQNVHLTAKDVFAPRGPEHESLIHPVQFAKAAMHARNERQRPGFPHAEVVDVFAFRGLPHSDHDWEQNRRCLDQQTRWTADGAHVELRDLKYTYRQGAGGRSVMDIHGRKEPIGRPREKGIDVLCALACVREAARPEVDLVVLASRDTDLVPVLDQLYDARSTFGNASARIETVAWFNRRAKEEGGRQGGQLRPTAPRTIWNTNLGRSVYEASIDRHDYR